MSTAEANRQAQSALASSYRRALGQLFAGAGESALLQAYEIGRRAVAEGVSLLELASIHHASLEDYLANDPTPGDPREKRLTALTFFAESLMPHEMASRAHQESVAVLRHFNEMLEQQARKIAHSIHDGAGQLLVTVHLALADLEQELTPEARRRLTRVTEQLNKVENELRTLSHELRPTMLDDLGLAAALDYLITAVSKRHGLQIDFRSDVRGRLRGSLEILLYRVVQEALNNVGKHAQAQRAWVHIYPEGGVVHCDIRDNGKGFETSPRSFHPPRGLGLTGIAERLRAAGGRLKVDSAPGRGTHLHITVPAEE